ncbi:phage major capsid protein [Muricoccus radiodurans]|uniref:phage major capsid protein n=1 Tax=Muricoccus radiodurans TaxID=2231721 RepID=UPI003CFBA184
MNMRDLLARRAAIAAEMRGINDKPGGESGDLSTEQRTRWDALKAELDGLEQRISRQAAVDDAERRAQGEPVGGTGDRDLDRELRSFSLVRAIASQVPGVNVDAAREREVSQEIARRAGRPFEGMAVPMAVFHRPVEARTVTSTLPADGPGGNLIRADHRGDLYIDMLRAALLTRRLGATVLSGLFGNVAIPKLKESATASWVAENTAIPLSDEKFAQVTLAPKHVGARTEFSRNMLQQSSPDIETLVRADFAAVLAEAVDRGAIAGSGTGAEPRGILNTPGIGSVAVGTNGGPLTWAKVLELIGTVEDANVEGTGFASNGKVARKARQTLRDAGLPGYLMDDPRTLAGYDYASSSLVPANGTKGTGTSLSSLIFGRWPDLLLGYWSEFDLLVNPFAESSYSKGNVQVRGMITMDVAVRYPESFAAIRDITTT